ncbi:acyltransferase [uncultured Spirosoma sp.]|uniref:acyltransferase n=1 Tax=uncultured Spirosoma sp. TaxID=278208 RepID=UPI0025869100|nr:acyltransferase [uncultured Spirosoma sp.]
MIAKLVKSLSNIFLSSMYNIKFGNYSSISIPYLKIVNNGKIIIGNNTTLGKHTWIAAYGAYANQTFKPTIKIGDNVSIGNYLCLTAIDSIVINNGCLLSEYVFITDHFHGTDPNQGTPASQNLYSKGSTEIGENTFIGYRATILSGVKLGRHCVVGAHSVVNKSFPDYSVIAGVPARLIKTQIY